MDEVKGLTVSGVLLTAFDALSTYFLISRGYAIEGNPVIAKAMDSFGTVPVLALRTIVGSVLLVCLGQIVTKHFKYKTALISVVGILGLVAIYHAYLYLMIIGEA